jgi:archaellum component FlaC
MNFPPSAAQTADLTSNWGANSFCYPLITIKKIWAEIPPEVNNLESLIKPVLDWLEVVDSNDIVVLHGEVDAVKEVRKNLSDQVTVLTPVITTGGGEFKHVRFKVI